tara:strand:- start:1286 stop:1837 length:552 start_codon:yes stop_codon:yes gene_type:complete
MKFNYLIKGLPLITTLFLIIILSISNQKEYTKLRILIWNTPKLTLGSYLALSTGTGFIVSYLITNSLAKTKNNLSKESLRYKEIDDNTDEEIKEYNQNNNTNSYENTLIERDIRDPSPTINANFRIIGRTDRISSDFIDNNNYKSNRSNNFEEQYDEQTKINDSNNLANSNSGDWNDESYSRW